MDYSGPCELHDIQSTLNQWRMVFPTSRVWRGDEKMGIADRTFAWGIEKIMCLMKTNATRTVGWIRSISGQQIPRSPKRNKKSKSGVHRVLQHLKSHRNTITFQHLIPFGGVGGMEKGFENKLVGSYVFFTAESRHTWSPQ